MPRDSGTHQLSFRSHFYARNINIRTSKEAPNLTQIHPMCTRKMLRRTDHGRLHSGGPCGCWSHLSFTSTSIYKEAWPQWSQHGWVPTLLLLLAHTLYLLKVSIRLKRSILSKPYNPSTSETYLYNHSFLVTKQHVVEFMRNNRKT